MNFLVFASLLIGSSFASPTISIRIPSDDRLSSRNSSASLLVSPASNTAISTPTIEDTNEVLTLSPIRSPFLHRKIAEIEDIVRASNSCILSKDYSANCLEDLLALLREGYYLEDLFHTIMRFEYHELAYYAALHHESMAWYFIVTFIESPEFNSKIESLLDSYPLLMITVRPKFTSEIKSTSICKLAMEKANEGIFQLCHEKLGENSYSQLLSCSY